MATFTIKSRVYGLVAGAMTLVLSTSAALSDNFYLKSAGSWAVVGLSETNTSPAQCIIHTQWKDKVNYSFVVIKDLSDDELYLSLTTPDTVYSGGKNDTILGMIEFRKLDEEVSYKATATFYTRSKNTLHIRHIEEEAFMNRFTRFDQINILIPGNTINIYANLKGSEKMPAFLDECASVHKTLKSSTSTKKKKIAL